MRAMASSIPPELVLELASLGQRIRYARIRRKLRVEDVAQKAQVSKKTVEAVERGAPTTGIGAYLTILACMGLARELGLLADPGLDREGATLEYSTAERRVRVSRRVNNDF
jgi:transcriptional regulator with XRE-family HTH domain